METENGLVVARGRVGSQREGCRCDSIEVTRGGLCGDGIVFALDCGGIGPNQHVEMAHVKLYTPAAPMSIFWL